VADITDGYSWWSRCARNDCDLHIVRPGEAACDHEACNIDGYGQLEKFHSPENKYDKQENTMTIPIKRQELWAVRLHDRETEADPVLATLMRAWEPEGPWHDIATGHPDNIWEIFELHWLREEINHLRQLCDEHGINWATELDD